MTAYKELRSRRAHAAKDANNQQLAAVAKAHLGKRASWRCLALDGPSLRTTKTLMATRRVKAVVLPQLDPAAARLMSRTVRKDAQLSRHVTVMACAMKEALARRHKRRAAKPPKVDVAYFDYTCSISGSAVTGHRPMQDIRMFLRDHAADKLVLAMTFSARMPEGLRDGCACALDQMKLDHIYPAVAAAGFSVCSHEEKTYKRTAQSATMAWFCLALRRP